MGGTAQTLYRSNNGTREKKTYQRGNAKNQKQLPSKQPTGQFRDQMLRGGTPRQPHRCNIVRASVASDRRSERIAPPVQGGGNAIGLQGLNDNIIHSTRYPALQYRIGTFIKKQESQPLIAAQGLGKTAERFPAMMLVVIGSLTAIFHNRPLCKLTVHCRRILLIAKHGKDHNGQGYHYHQTPEIQKYSKKKTLHLQLTSGSAYM
jgi:hypothetical protein